MKILRAALYSSLLGLFGCGSSDAPSEPVSLSLGELAISTRTVGDQVDSDGYSLVLDNASEVALPANGEVRIPDLTAGSHSFDVGGVASNCRRTNGPSSGSVFVPSGDATRLDLEVFCLQPNPGRIIYTTVDGVVHVMNALGGDKQILPIRANKVQLSADQEKLVYDWADDIWVADADGSNPTNLTQTPDRGEGVPSWSPDRRQIAYERQEVIGNSPNYLFTMNADGSGVTRLAPPEWTAGEPAWSPDGTRIAFRSHHSSISPEGALWTIAPDGSQLTQLTVGGSFDTNPSWSPDVERIVFTRFRGSVDEGGTDFDLFVINADGTGFRQLTRDDRRRSTEADWSPDGRWIVFASGDLNPGGVFDLFMIGSDGTDKVQLTFGERAGFPNWVP